MKLEPINKGLIPLLKKLLKDNGLPIELYEEFYYLSLELCFKTGDTNVIESYNNQILLMLKEKEYKKKLKKLL